MYWEFGMQVEKCMQLVANSEGKFYLKDLTIGGSILLKWVLKKWDVVMWAGFIVLRVGINNVLLWIRRRRLRFRDIRGNYGLHNCQLRRNVFRGDI